MTDALVAMHGYDPDGMDGGKPFEDVVEDRFEKTYQVADMLQDWGVDVDVVISGGGDYDGRTEAELVYDHVRETYPDEAADIDVRLEDASGNTAENVEELHAMAQDLDVDTVVTVSSRDHAPRVLRDWNQEVNADIPLIAAVGSQDTYAASEMEPFIVEGAAFAPFIDAFNHVWGVDPDRYEEAAAEVAEVLQQYHDD